MEGLIWGTDDELLKEFFNYESSVFMLHQNINPFVDSSSNCIASSIQPHIVYPGPTVEDIESALSYANYEVHHLPTNEAELEAANRISPVPEKGCLNKDNNHDNSYRYSLRIKSSSNVVADDGYKWRKYGQKSIKNSPNPRSYYRCTNPRCSAKRQVERSIDDPDTLIITYEGLHFHFDYPFFMMDQHHEMDPPTKKQRGPILEAQYKARFTREAPVNTKPSPIVDSIEIEQELIGTQGLLEDMVPLMIRKPLMTNFNNNISGSSNSTSCASRESHPSSPASSTSFTWSSEYSFPGFI